jgi:hypothetical protein
MESVGVCSIGAANTKAECDAVGSCDTVGTCDTADCSSCASCDSEADCLATAGTCEGADPAIPGQTTKALCDGGTVAGTFTSSASYAVATWATGTCAGATPDVAGMTTVEDCDGGPMCEGALWAGTEAACLEGKGTCAGADPDIPDGTCDSAGWVGTPAACEESAGTCAGADPDVPGTTTKALCDAATTAGTFTSTAAYVLTPTTKAACDGAATTAGTFTSAAAYVAGVSSCEGARFAGPQVRGSSPFHATVHPFHTAADLGRDAGRVRGQRWDVRADRRRGSVHRRGAPAAVALHCSQLALTASRPTPNLAPKLIPN